MTEVGAEIELEITDVAYGGKGVGRAEGCVVFVPGTLTGEKVRVRIKTRKKKFMEADPVEILVPAPGRIEPDCELTGKCPGCCYRHVSYEEEVRIKQSQLETLLERFASVAPGTCLPPVPSPRSDNYRNKIVLHVAGEEGSPVIGYFGHDNRTVMDVKTCPLAVEQINAELAGLRGDQEFISGIRPGQRIGFRWTETDGVVRWPSESEIPALTELTEWGPLKVPAKSFFQVNPWVSPKLADAVSVMIKEIAPEYFMDMYCGMGIFSIAAAALGVRHVLGVERSRASIRSARKNARKMGLEGLEFVCGKVEDLIADAVKELQAGKTAILVDPPRQGLDKRFVNTLLNFCPQHIIYVSCAADTLARDIAAFTEKNYMLRSVQMLDMFPRTRIFESIALLERVN